MWQSCTVQIACYCRHSWIPLIRTWLFQIPPDLNSKPFPLDLPFRHLLWVISNSCYFKPFYITSMGWKQHGSTESISLTTAFQCFLLTAPKLYTLLHSVNSRILTRRLRTVAAEARSSCITSSLLFAPTLRWWLPTYHDDVTTSTCQQQFLIIKNIY